MNKGINFDGHTDLNPWDFFSFEPNHLAYCCATCLSYSERVTFDLMKALVQWQHQHYEHNYFSVCLSVTALSKVRPFTIKIVPGNISKFGMGR